MKSPDQEVASRIIEQFRKARILSEKTLEKLGPILAAGKLSAVDWQTIFDFDRHKEQSE